MDFVSKASIGDTITALVGIAGSHSIVIELIAWFRTKDILLLIYR